MLNMQTWARKYGVGNAAILELNEILRAPSEPVYAAKQPPMSEAAVQQRAQLSAAQAGGVLWRNNVGAAVDHAGRPVRYGLANLSSRMNAQVKSSDLIGITPVWVTADMVGTKVGLFTAIECKHGGWRWGQDPAREEAQYRFHTIVTAHGGLAEFVSR